MTDWWWAYLAVGAFVGFFSGLLGVGGGAAMVPVLAFIFADRAPAVLRAVPPAVLGAMMVYVGVCHALLLRGLTERLWLAWAIGLIGLLTGNLALALGFGLLAEEGGIWAKYWPSASA